MQRTKQDATGSMRPLLTGINGTKTNCLADECQGWSWVKTGDWEGHKMIREWPKDQWQGVCRVDFKVVIGEYENGRDRCIQ
jgi:hypothetical protein